MEELIKYIKGLTVPEILMWILIIAAVLTIFFVLIDRLTSPRKKAQGKPSKAESKQAKKEKAEAKAQAKADKKLARKVQNPVVAEPEPEPVQEENQSASLYVSPLILDRTKYEIALQEKLEREKQEKLARQAREAARLEMLKNKEFQSHAGFINGLQRFSKKETLEEQIANGGKVDRELLNTYINEKGPTISEEFANMSPELKAVVLSDLMKRKY